MPQRQIPICWGWILRFRSERLKGFITYSPGFSRDQGLEPHRASELWPQGPLKPVILTATLQGVLLSMSCREGCRHSGRLRDFSGFTRLVIGGAGTQLNPKAAPFPPLIELHWIYRN